MSEERVEVKMVENEEMIWKGSSKEARASKKLSKELVRMVEKTAADGIERIQGNWKCRKI